MFFLRETKRKRYLVSAITQLQFRLIDVLLNFYSTILRPTLTTSAVTQITMAPAKRSSALRYMGSAMELSPPSWWFLYLLPSSLCCSHFSLENRINKRYLFSAIASLLLSVIATVIIRIITLFFTARLPGNVKQSFKAVRR